MHEIRQVHGSFVWCMLSIIFFCTLFFIFFLIHVVFFIFLFLFSISMLLHFGWSGLQCHVSCQLRKSRISLSFLVKSAMICMGRNVMVTSSMVVGFVIACDHHVTSCLRQCLLADYDGGIRARLSYDCCCWLLDVLSLMLYICLLSSPSQPLSASSW